MQASKELSDPGEIPWLKERKGTPLKAATVHAMLRALNDRVEAHERAAGDEAHQQGSVLLELYARYAERALGYVTFDALLDAECVLSRSTAYTRMRLARATTREAAARHGLSRCLVGLSLVAELELDELVQLETRDLPVEPKYASRAKNGKDGPTVRFPAPLRLLESALRLLRARKDSPRVPRSLTEEVRRTARLIEAQQEQDEHLAAVRPVAYVHDGRLLLRLKPMHGREQYAAVEKLLRRLGQAK